MNVLYSETTRQGGEELALMQRVTTQLEEVLGPSAALVKVEWDRTQDERGRVRIALRLSDWMGAVSTTFAPNELRSPSRLRYRLICLWGDLLQIRSHKQLEKLIGASDEAGE